MMYIPTVFLLGPKGGDKIAELIRQCAQKAKVKYFLTLDDNIERISFCTAGPAGVTLRGAIVLAHLVSTAVV